MFPKILDTNGGTVVKYVYDACRGSQKIRRILGGFSCGLHKVLDANGVRNKCINDVHVWLKWFSCYM